MTITKADAPRFTFREYRKVGTTKLSDELLEPGQKVETLEGEYTCAEPSRLALDVKGNVYPVAESVFRKSYAPPGDASRELKQWQRYAAYCRSAVKSGENDVQEFEAFIAMGA